MVIKVVIFLFYSEGGMYHYCFALAKALSKYCHVFFYVPKKLETLTGNDNLTILTHDLPKANKPASFFKIKNVFNVVNEITKINPTIVHFPSTNYVLSILLPLIRLFFPVVTTIHDPEFHPSDHSTIRVISRKITIKKSNSLIVHDYYGKKILSSTYPSKQIFIIRHISFEDIFKNNFKEKYSFEDKNSYVLFFGRLCPYKGISTLLDAATELRDKNPNIKIKIYGKGKISISNDKLKNIDNISLNNRYVNDDEVPEIFMKSKFLVLPYINASQSGIIPIAYYFGKPVIVTRVGGLPESVIEGKTGIIIKPNDAKSLSEKINYLWNLNNEEYLQFSKNCKEWLNKKISPNIIAKRTLKVYYLTLMNTKQNDFPTD